MSRRRSPMLAKTSIHIFVKPGPTVQTVGIIEILMINRTKYKSFAACCVLAAPSSTNTLSEAVQQPNWLTIRITIGHHFYTFRYSLPMLSRYPRVTLHASTRQIANLTQAFSSVAAELTLDRLCATSWVSSLVPRHDLLYVCSCAGVNQLVDTRNSETAIFRFDILAFK